MVQSVDDPNEESKNPMEWPDQAYKTPLNENAEEDQPFYSPV
jgi:hypothetical protein